MWTSNRKEKTRSNRAVGMYVNLLLLMVVMLISPLSTAAPKAGSVIGNQASATYTDSEGNSYSTTSNLVETVVQSVYGVTLVGDHTTFVTAGGTAYFPHVLTNTGNADDTFTLAATNAAGDDIDFSSLALYLDADRDGNPDSSQAVTSISLTAGTQINVVLGGVVSGLSTADATATATLTATSDNDGTQTDSVTDSATIRTGSVINVVKSMSATSGSPDANSGSATAYTVTLSYHNTGNAAGASLTITDTLPAGMHYVDDSGRASLTGSQTLTDDDTAEVASSNGSVLTYEYDSVSHDVEFTLDSIPASGSGYVRFQVYILATDNDGNPLTAGNISNTATYSYDGQATQSTNTVQFSVSSQASVALDTSGLDTQTVASAGQGSEVSFNHTVSNSGNISDTFNLVLSTDSYPAGTAFKLYRADGVTPLVDTNGDGVIDTGIIASGADLDIVLKVSLPPDSSGGPSQITLTASSVASSSVSDGVIAELTTITALSADLTANATVADGGDGIGNPGAGGEATPVDSDTVQPGSELSIPLFINNAGGTQDNYDLSVANLPSGWEVSFFHDANGDGDIDSAEPALVNTGSVAASGNIALIAVISIPEGATPGDNDLVFLSQSPNSSAVDYLKYRVAVDNTYGLDVSLDNNSQAAAGTSVVLMHRVKNTGNTASGDISLALSHSNSQGWSGTIYMDDGATDGALDSTDTVYDPASPPSLAADAEMVIFVRVIVPLSATPGARDAITFTASISTPDGAVSDSAIDSVTVIGTEIELTKTQALDAACDGAADAAFGNGSISSGAVPGACLIYRITATNSGSESVSEVVVYDSTPSFTTVETTAHTPSVTVGGSSYTAGGDCSTPTPGVSTPADEATGTVTGYICDLSAGASGYLEFSVQIDP